MEPNVNYSVIEVVKKKSAVGLVGKIFGMTMGACGMLIGSILCVTIIGALIGFPLMIMSMGLIAGAQGFQKVTCASCGKKQDVLKTAENLTCSRCKQLTVINWK